MEAFEEVLDSLCVPQYSKDGEERVVLFLKMAAGHHFQSELGTRIRDAIRRGLSARHVPSLILETLDIPVRPARLPPPAARSHLGRVWRVSGLGSSVHRPWCHCSCVSESAVAQGRGVCLEGSQGAAASGL